MVLKIFIDHEVGIDTCVRCMNVAHHEPVLHNPTFCFLLKRATVRGRRKYEVVLSHRVSRSVVENPVGHVQSQGIGEVRGSIGGVPEKHAVRGVGFHFVVPDSMKEKRNMTSREGRTRERAGCEH